MKKMRLIAGAASLAAVVGLTWSVPASAHPDPHDKGWMHFMFHHYDKSGGTASGDTPSPVPEPGSLALLALGLGGLGIARRRRR